MIATAIPLLLALASPTVNATCFSSPIAFALGAGNAPVNNDRATSVVNIWAFVNTAKPSAPVAGWVYKNVVGNYVFQGNQKIPDIAALLKDGGLGHDAWTQKFTGSNLPLVAFHDAAQLVRLENVLSEHGYARVACFTKDLLIQY